MVQRVIIFLKNSLLFKQCSSISRTVHDVHPLLLGGSLLRQDHFLCVRSGRWLISSKWERMGAGGCSPQFPLFPPVSASEEISKKKSSKRGNKTERREEKIATRQQLVAGANYTCPNWATITNELKLVFFCGIRCGGTCAGTCFYQIIGWREEVRTV